MADVAAVITQEAVIGGAVETTKGTAETVSAALSMLFEDADFAPGDWYSEGQRLAGPYSGELPGVRDAQSGTAKFTSEVHHGDSTLTVLAVACGLKDATGYKPHSSQADHKCATLALFESGVKKLLYGAMGNGVLQMELGQPAKIEWEFQGIWSAPTDAAVPSFTIPTTTPLLCMGITLTIAGSSVRVTRASLDFGAQVVLRRDMTKSTGIYHAALTGARHLPTLSIDPEAELVATRDDYGLLLAGTTAAVNIVLSDGSNTWTITSTKGFRRSITPGDRDGIRTREIVLALCPSSSGDDAFTITES